MDNVANLKHTYLTAALTDSATTLYVPPSVSASFPAAPFRVTLSVSRGLSDLSGSEIVRVTAKNDGTGAWTIVRGYESTVARAHVAGELVMLLLTAGLYQDVAVTLAEFVARAFGNAASGVIRTEIPTTGLAVIATTGMVVQVSVGIGFVNRIPVKIASASNLTIVAPTTNPRIAMIQIHESGLLSIKYGTEAGSPVAPSVDSGAMALATIATTVGMSTIVTGDITDVRSFY